MTSSDTEAPTPPFTVITNLQPSKSNQLGLGNSKLVDTSKIRKCSVSTTVCDVRYGYFRDGRNPEKQHEAAAVVLEFEFGSQQRDSWKPWERIRQVSINVSVEEAENIEPGDAGGKELLIAAYYPRSARGTTSELVVNKSKGGTATISAGNVGYARAEGALTVSKTYSISNAMTLTSTPNGQMSITWKLEEDKTLKQGVPEAISCALLLQTDQIPFDLHIKFVAPVMGIKSGGEVAVPLKNDKLWERKQRAEWEGTWEDFDSEDFKEWVRRKTAKAWVKEADYSAKGD